MPERPYDERLFIFISAVVCSAFEKLKKFTVPAYVLSFVYVAVLGFTRMVRGAHFLTDVSLGAIIGMVFFLFALGVLKLFEKKNILPIRHLKINKERKRDGYEKIFK